MVFWPRPEAVWTRLTLSDRTWALWFVAPNDPLLDLSLSLRLAAVDSFSVVWLLASAGLMTMGRNGLMSGTVPRVSFLDLLPSLWMLYVLCNTLYGLCSVYKHVACVVFCVCYCFWYDVCFVLVVFGAVYKHVACFMYCASARCILLCTVCV